MREPYFILRYFDQSAVEREELTLRFKYLVDAEAEAKRLMDSGFKILTIDKAQTVLTWLGEMPQETEK